MKVKLEEAKKYIKDADVLLFRPSPFPSVGWFISKYTQSPYSHVALVHWRGDSLICVEQREFKGGRAVSLERQVEENPGRIDVFRALSKLVVPSLDNGEVVNEKVVFRDEIAQEIINSAYKMTGEQYGWKNILEIAKGYLPFFRLKQKKINDEVISQSHVCSTLVAQSYRLHYIDPCPFINDAQVTPGDLARSRLFSYLFTIE